MIGHKEAPYTDLGWAAARFDDLLNWVPARLAGLILCVAGGGGWAVLRRDRRKHASPNAGWPEAALAGALGIRLAGRSAMTAGCTTSHGPGGAGDGADQKDGGKGKRGGGGVELGGCT